MDDKDVRIIEDYIDHNVPEPSVNDRDDIFELHAYSRWAAYEILERVIYEAMKLPSHISGKESLTLRELVENFIDEMDYYVSVSTSEQVKNIFSIAKDEGRCVLLYICSR